MILHLERQAPAEWPALAPLVHAWNRRGDGGVHCVHAASGDDAASHAEELAALAPDEAAFWAVRREDRVVGMFGCEIDAALGRAWLRGPLAGESDVLDALLPLVDATLSAAFPSVTTFDAFPAADGARLNDWYRAAGYTPLMVHTAMRADAGAFDAPPAEAEAARASDLPEMLGLHLALFPSPYLGEEAFRRALDAPDCALFVARGGDAKPLGYLYVEDRPAEDEAYVHYLGVADAARGRGFGQALLGRAAKWGVDRGRSGIALTVREDRPVAIELYRRAGFVELSKGRQWRRTVR